MEIELPATSRKDFFLYIYFTDSYSQKLNISLLNGNRVLKQVSESINCLGKDGMLFGVLTDNASTFEALNDVKPIKGYARVADLEISDLPDRVQSLSMLDGLVVSNIDTGLLTAKQKEALKSWVAAGGKLFIVGGFNWQGTVSGLKDLMPIELDSTRHVDSLSQLQAYVRAQEPLESEALLASGTLKEGAQVLVSQDEVPLLIKKSLGFGVIYFFAADPALQPLSNWVGMKDVYEHLLGSHIQYASWVEGIEYDYQAEQALATIPELGLPSAFSIWCLLGLYITVIGPLNYFVLRRFGRRELAWLTIPVLVVLFSGLAYGTGFFYRGVTPILNRLAIAQAWEGADQAQVYGLVGIYSPIRTKYVLEASNPFFIQPFDDGNSGLQANNQWTLVQQDSNMMMPEVQGEIAAMKSVAVKGSIPALEFRHDLRITINDSSPVLSGTLTNKSPYHLRDAILVTSGGWKRLGDFSSGQSIKVNVPMAISSYGPTFFSTDSMGILRLRPADLETNQDAARRNAFLNILLNFRNGTNRGNWGVYLLGWVENIELPATLQNKQSRTIDTLLYVDQLAPSIKIEPGESRLPMSLFVWESSTSDASPYHASEVPSGGYVLRFQPAVPVPLREVKSLDLSLSSNRAYQDLVASAWDYDLKTWVRIPLIGSPVHIPEPNRYIGPDGEVRIQIRSTGSNWTEIQSSYITMVVEP